MSEISTLCVHYFIIDGPYFYDLFVMNTAFIIMDEYDNLETRGVRRQGGSGNPSGRCGLLLYGKNGAS